MSRSFSIIGSDLAIPGADTIAYLRPSATVAIEIFEVRIGFFENATSAQQPVQLVRQVVSGGGYASTAVTPLPYDAGTTQACSITGGTGNMDAATGGVGVTVESGGARSVIVADAFNVLTGWVWVPGPDGRLIVPANSGSIFGVYFPVVPGTTSGGFNVTVSFHEL